MSLSSSPMTEDAPTLPLFLISTQPFDFVTIADELKRRCADLLSWYHVGSTVTGVQRCINAVMQAQMLVYHLVARPCTNVPRRSIPFKGMHESNQMLLVYDRMHYVLTTHLSQVVLPALQAPCGANENMLQRYLHQWRLYMVGTANMRTVFAQLYVTWNSYSFPDDTLSSVDEVALNLWYSQVLKLVAPALQTAVEQALPACWELSTAMATKSSRSLLADLQYALSMMQDETYYKQILEQPYLHMLASRHRNMPSYTFAVNDLARYAQDALREIHEERCRAGRYLRNSDCVVECLTAMLVEERLDELKSAGLEQMIGSDDEETMGALCAVFKLLTLSSVKGLAVLQRMFAAYVTHTVVQSVEQQLTLPRSVTMFRQLVYALVDTIGKLLTKVRLAFDDDRAMMRCMEEAVMQGIASIGADSVDLRSLVEQFAALTHLTLCTSNDEAAQTQGGRALSVEDIVSLYFYLARVDDTLDRVFLQCHRRYLAERLLYRTFDVARERRLLDCMMLVQRSPLLFFCRSMLQGATSGRIFCRVDSASCTSVAAILPNTIWPLPGHPNLSNGMDGRGTMCIPCGALQAQLDTAHALCQGRRPYHRIELVKEYCTGVVSVHLPGTHTTLPDTTVQLRLSLPQLCIATLFNERAMWRVQELCETLRLTPAECRLALRPLLNADVLACDARTAEDGTPTAGATGMYGRQIRLGQCRGVRTRMMELVPSWAETAIDTTPAVSAHARRTSSAPSTMRLMEVHIMKLLKHEDAIALDVLYDRVRAAVQPGKAERHDFKRCIDHLMERGFVTRVVETNMYKYAP